MQNLCKALSLGMCCCRLCKLNSEYKATKFQSPSLQQTEAEARAEKHQSTRAEENETKLYTAI